MTALLPSFAALDDVSLWLVAALVRVTIDGALVAGPVWLACRFVPTLSANVRTWLWWGVSLKLLLSLAGAPALSIPVLPASWTLGLAGAASGQQVGRERSEGAAAHVVSPALARGSEASAPRDAVASAQRDAVASAQRGPGASAPGSHIHAAPGVGRATGTMLVLRAAAAAWLALLFIQLALLVLDARRLRRIVGRAARSAPALEDEHEDLAKDLGLRSIPAVRESADVIAPQVVGLWRPTVLLPHASALAMSAHERTMVLCHELAHVRRGDLWLGWIPAIAERLLVWHPIARLAAREYAIAREAACDALVLRTLDAPARDYGRLLVRLGVHPAAARIAAAGTSPTARALHRRLQMLQQTSFSSRAKTGLIVAAAFVALVPLRLVAMPASTGTADAAERATADVSTPAVSASPALSAAPAVAAEAPASAAVSATPAALREPEQDERRGRDEQIGWVYLYGDSDDVSSRGDWDDVRLARTLRGANDGAFFLVRRSDGVYTITDATLLEQVDALFAPMRKVGAQQGELGARQGALGVEQGAIGLKQGALGARQGEFGLRMAELSAQLAGLEAQRQRLALERMRERTASSDDDKTERANTEQRAQLESELRAKKREIERLMEEQSARQNAIGAEQEALGRQQEALGRRQEELGRQQEVLGREQERESRRAEREIATLVDRAITSGIARKAQ